MQGFLVSVIIPVKDSARREDIKTLLNDIYNQDINAKIEICEITGVSPSGKARNLGAEKTKGDILIFLDDDIALPHKKIFKNLISSLFSSEKAAISGAPQLIPKDSNLFQRLCARDIPHVVRHIVEEPKEVQMVSSNCLAVKRDVFFKVGKFNEKLLRGIDVEFCARIKKNNYKIILAPKTWIYHPPPRNLLELVKLSFRNGFATAFADRRFPELIFDIGLDNLTYTLQRKSKVFRLWRYIKEVIKAAIFLRPVGLIYKIVYALGYFYNTIFCLGDNV